MLACQLCVLSYVCWLVWVSYVICLFANMGVLWRMLACQCRCLMSSSFLQMFMSYAGSLQLKSEAIIIIACGQDNCWRLQQLVSFVTWFCDLLASSTSAHQLLAAIWAAFCAPCSLLLSISSSASLSASLFSSRCSFFHRHHFIPKQVAHAWV